MTKHECAVVTAFTGISMLRGEDIKYFYDYIAQICGRPIYTHELSQDNVWQEIKEKSTQDFYDLCRNASDVKTDAGEMNDETAK